MTRICQITGKRQDAGNRRSHSLRATRTRRKVNLVTKKIVDPKTGHVRRMRIAASTLRTLTKKAA